MSDKQKILIVEDDPLIGSDLSSTLSEYGYAVIGPITTGEAAISEIKEFKPDFVLMDIGLPGKIDGIQAAEEIQKITSVPVVFLTGLSDEASLQRAKLTNPFGYLIKPYDGMELHSTIQLTLHRFKSETPHAHEAHATERITEGEYSESTPTLERCVDFLSKIPLFRGLSPASLRELGEQCIIREFDAAQYLVREGEAASGIFIPLSGRISITKASESGKELIVTLLAPGDVFGVFYSLEEYSGSTSARTQVASKVIWIPVTQWSSFLERDSSLQRNLAAALAERLAAAHVLASSLAHSRVEGRIINALIALLPSFGRSTANGHNEGRIFITRKELAELTGTTPETAIRVTKNLERGGHLDLTRPGIIKIPKVDSLRSLVAA